MGKQYRFFEELSERIERLRARLTIRPGALAHRGLDLSHAFARQLYFAAGADDALYRLWQRAQGIPVPHPGRLSGTAVALLARDWFGADKARDATPLGLHLRRAVAPLRLLAGRGEAREAEQGAARPILLFAHSLRFARFLAPVAQRLGARCAFLVSASDTGTRQWAAAQGHAVRLYHPASRGLRRSGSVLAQYAPGLALFAEEIEAALRGSGARVVLVPEGNAPVDEVLSQVGRRIGIVVACLQQGWSPLVHTGFRNMSYAEMLVWGEGFADILAPFNPGQAFHPVGNFQLPEGEGDVVARPHGVAFFCQGSGSWTSQEDEDLMVTLACKIAAARPALPVFVRPHPVQPFDAVTQRQLRMFANVQISDPRQQPLADVLIQISVGVSIYSSTILECVAAGVVPVIFNMTTMPGYLPPVAALGAGVEARTLDDALGMLMTLTETADVASGFLPAIDRFNNEFFARKGGQALETIYEELERLCAGGPYNRAATGISE
jgi:hypothetical protein